MSIAPEPTALGLVAAGQARLEVAFAEMRGEIGAKLDTKADRSDITRLETTLAHGEDERRRDRVRIERLEQDAALRNNTAATVAEQKGRFLTRREKMWGAFLGATTLGGIWFGPVMAQAFTGHH